MLLGRNLAHLENNAVFKITSLEIHEIFIVILRIIKVIYWLVTFIYGYPQHYLQNQLWKIISNLKRTSIHHWMIIGDLNN